MPKPEKAVKKPRRYIRPQRKGERASLEREVTALWSRVVLHRDDHMCRAIEEDGSRCQAPGTEPHHIMRRAYHSTKWLPSNGLSLCSRHHRFDLLRLKEMCIRTIGLLQWERLRSVALNGKVPSDDELMMIKKRFEMVLKNGK